jgi:sodium transport system ATP-binding protein
MAEPLVIADRLRREFPQRSGETLVAVQDASFTVDGGEVFGLLGPNGAGKSTTLRMLATLVTPTSGRVEVCGHDAARHPERVRESLGYLSATSGLPGRLTCREVLWTFAVLQRMLKPHNVVEAALDRYGVRRFADRFVDGLSTGMRQRLRIACAAVHRPPVLILDEPTSGLDVVAADSLMSVIEDLKHEGAAVIFSTHVLPEAERLCDRIAVIYEGSILAVDTPDNLIRLTRAPDLRGAFLRVIAGR